MVRHAPSEGNLCISLRPPGTPSLIEGRSMRHTIGYVATSMYLDKSQLSHYSVQFGKIVVIHVVDPMTT